MKTGDQRPVERLPGLRVAQGSQDGAAVGKFGARRQYLQRIRTAPTGDAHDRDRRPAGARGEREDRVVIGGEHGPALDLAAGERNRPPLSASS
jgi:hypothetical protein